MSFDDFMFKKYLIMKWNKNNETLTMLITRTYLGGGSVILDNNNFKILAFSVANCICSVLSF